MNFHSDQHKSHSIVARISVAFFSTAMMGLLVTGCSGAAQPGDTSTPTPDATLTAPEVSAKGNANDVTLSWAMRSPSGGPEVTTVQIETTDGISEVGPSGSKSEGTRRNQERCIRARAQDADGNWGPWSDEKCAQTWDAWKATQIIGDDTKCSEGIGPEPCHKVMIKIERANPNSTVTCKLDSTFGYDKTVDFTVDDEGNAYGQFADWVTGDGFDIGNPNLTDNECKQK